MQGQADLQAGDLAVAQESQQLLVTQARPPPNIRSRCCCSLLSAWARAVKLIAARSRTAAISARASSGGSRRSRTSDHSSRSPSDADQLLDDLVGQCRPPDHARMDLLVAPEILDHPLQRGLGDARPRHCRPAADHLVMPAVDQRLRDHFRHPLTGPATASAYCMALVRTTRTRSSSVSTGLCSRIGRAISIRSSASCRATSAGRARWPPPSSPVPAAPPTARSRTNSSSTASARAPAIAGAQLVELPARTWPRPCARALGRAVALEGVDIGRAQTLLALLSAWCRSSASRRRPPVATAPLPLIRARPSAAANAVEHAGNVGTAVKIRLPLLKRAAMTSPAAAEIVRGTMRLLLDLDLTSLPEFTLATGRRVDLMALGRDGRLVAIEVKSCRTDFLTDRKWHGLSRLRRPVLLRRRARISRAISCRTDEGLIVADRYAASADPARRRHAGGGRRPTSRAPAALRAHRRVRGCRAPPTRTPAPSPPELNRLSPPRPAIPRAGNGRCCRAFGSRTGRRSRPRARPRSNQPASSISSGSMAQLSCPAPAPGSPASAIAGTARAATRDRPYRRSHPHLLEHLAAQRLLQQLARLHEPGQRRVHAGREARLTGRAGIDRHG